MAGKGRGARMVDAEIYRTLAHEREELAAGLAMARGCVARYAARLAQCEDELRLFEKERAELADGRFGRSRSLLQRIQ